MRCNCQWCLLHVQVDECLESIRERVMREHVLRQARRDRRRDIIQAIVLGVLLGTAIGIPFVL